MPKVAPFSREFEPLIFVAPGIWGTRSGEFGCVLRIGEGPDTECLDPVEINAIASRWENAQRSLDSTRISSYTLKRPGFEPQACSERAQWLSEHANLYTIERYVVLIGGKSAEALRSMATAFAAHLADVIPLTLLGNDETLRFFRLLVGDDISIPRRVRLDLPIGRHLDTTVERWDDHIRVNGQYIRVVTLKEPTIPTIPDLMARVRRIDGTITVATDWKPMPAREARKMVESSIGHYHRHKHVTSFVTGLANAVVGLFSGPPQQQQRPEDMQKDESASSDEAQLGKLLAYLGDGGTLGELAVTFICSGETLKQANETAEAVIRSFAAADADCWLYPETRNTLNAWFASLPGGHRRNVRTMYATGENATSFATIFGSAVGNPRNEHLNADALTVLATREGTPYYLNLHFEDVGHFAVTGATGSGKTFLCRFLLAEAWRQYRPQTFIFDLKTSYEALALHYGGSVVRLDPDSAPRLNPFSLPAGKRTMDFLRVFIRTLLESGRGERLTDDDEREVSRAIERMYEPGFRAEQRQLSMLGLPRHLHRRMEKWLQGGPFGHLFDNARDDLAMADFQVFSFPSLGTGEIPEELEPLLLYVFHRASQIVYDPQRSLQMKVCLLDEAWRLIQSPAVRQYVIGAVKTWRDFNGVIGLATQSTGDLDNEVLRAFAQNAATLIFLADPRATAEDDRFWRLNSAEADARRGLQPKSEVLIKRPDHSKVVRLNAPEEGLGRNKQVIETHELTAMEVA